MISLRLGRLDVEIADHRVTLVGRIDDGCSLADLVPQIAAGSVVIDSGGVTFINSVGMRAWMRLVRALRDRGTVVLECVADVLMTQINLMPDHATGVQIASFHAQYACPACGAEAAPLVDAIVHAELLGRLQAPRLPCPECGSQMELGDFPERYLTIFRR